MSYITDSLIAKVLKIGISIEFFNSSGLSKKTNWLSLYGNLDLNNPFN
jgi:hypothetical protein